MCHCDSSKKDAEVFENALLAIDGAINTLVMARIIMEQRQEARTKKAPPPEEGAPCEHLNQIDTSTMGVPSAMCDDCGENL